MHLVDEQNGLRPTPGELCPGAVDGSPNLFHARGDRGDLDESSVGLPTDDRRDRGLTGSRWTPQEQGHRLVTLDQPPTRRARGEKGLVAGELIEGPWAHPHRER